MKCSATLSHQEQMEKIFKHQRNTAADQDPLTHSLKNIHIWLKINRLYTGINALDLSKSTLSSSIFYYPKNIALKKKSPLGPKTYFGILFLTIFGNKMNVV